MIGFVLLSFRKIHGVSNVNRIDVAPISQSGPTAFRFVLTLRQHLSAHHMPKLNCTIKPRSSTPAARTVARVTCVRESQGAKDILASDRSF